jgi:hypothetical protein
MPGPKTFVLLLSKSSTSAMLPLAWKCLCFRSRDMPLA